jgi:hypothetical protein
LFLSLRFLLSKQQPIPFVMRFSTFAFAAVLLPAAALAQFLAPDNALERSITLARGGVETGISTASGAINQTIPLASQNPVLQGVIDLTNFANLGIFKAAIAGLRIKEDAKAGRTPKPAEYVDT